MKKLQNNFTTPEQSKRLLELGLPADSADCYLLRTIMKGDTFIVEVLHDELYSKKDKFTNILEYLPCWSVGRLIEIYCILTNAKEFKMYTIGTLVEEIIYLLNAIKINGADFSKLEE